MEKILKTEPLVSVIIPTYNRAHTISRAIDSVLNQTYKNIELIIVDDASTDNTGEVIKRIKDERVLFFKNNINKGAPAVRNTGLTMAKGEFIAFQDSDDEWIPEKLAIQMDIFEKLPPIFGVVFSSFIFHKNNKVFYIPDNKEKIKEGNMHKSLLSWNFITLQASVIRKQCFESVGVFDERLPRLQDWEFFIRVSKCFNIKFIDRPLLNVYLQKNSISTSKTSLICALQIILEKHYQDFLLSNKKSLSKNYWWLGKLLYKENNYELSYQFSLKSLRMRPINVIHWVPFALRYFRRLKIGDFLKSC